MHRCLKTSISLAVFLIFTGTAGALFAQEADYYVPDSLRKGTDQPFDFQFSTGTSIASDFNGGSAFTTYVSPSIAYRLSPKWTLFSGVTVSNTQFSGWTNYSFDRNSSTELRELTQQSVFFQAAYAVNEKLTLYGGVQQQLFNLNPSGNQSSLSLSGTSYDIGLDYEVRKGLHFGVQLRQTNGFMPYQPAFQSPFQSSFYPGFGPGFRSW